MQGPIIYSTGDFENNKYGILQNISIHLEEHCIEMYPGSGMMEKYHLRVANTYSKIGFAKIVAKTSWGILRGLQSLSQLFYNDNFKNFINLTDIIDEPKYSHRGILIDTSRHFLSKKVIFQHLDVMEMNKLNVLHWHITDDNSFPFESQRFPNLSFYGAYNAETHVYKPNDVKEIIEFARVRGIRVIPEFDTPSHTKSWHLGNPEIQTYCQNNGIRNSGDYGPLDISKSSTFEFLSEFFNEIFETFPDEQIHLGGDEVALDTCWNKNHEMQLFAKQLAQFGNYTGLQNYYFTKLCNILSIKQPKKSFIVWEDVFQSLNGFLNKDITVQVWKNWNNMSWQERIKEVAKNGHKIVISSPWYLDNKKYGSDWVRFYNLELENISSLLIGGEICLWGEFINSYNSLTVTWPRASAPAEILWTGKAEEVHSAAARLQEHECRMIDQGYHISPILGSGFCKNDYVP